jgi:hypothetical protein
LGAKYVQASRAATLRINSTGAAAFSRVASRRVMVAAGAAEVVSISPTLAIAARAVAWK